MTPLRLITPDGKPTQTPAQRTLLKQAAKIEGRLDAMTSVLSIAIEEDDHELAASSIRGIMSLALYLNDYVRAADA